MSDPPDPSPDGPAPQQPTPDESSAEPTTEPATEPTADEWKPEHPVLSAGRFQAVDQTAANVTAYLITGPAVFGGLGWLLDRWLGTGFFIVIGMLGGMALSLYVIWLRYGTQ